MCYSGGLVILLCIVILTHDNIKRMQNNSRNRGYQSIAVYLFPLI